MDTKTREAIEVVKPLTEDLALEPEREALKHLISVIEELDKINLWLAKNYEASIRLLKEIKERIGVEKIAEILYDTDRNVNGKLRGEDWNELDINSMTKRIFIGLAEAIHKHIIGEEKK